MTKALKIIGIALATWVAFMLVVGMALVLLAIAYSGHSFDDETQSQFDNNGVDIGPLDE